MKEAYDVVVIGSGPAGLGVGLRLHDARLNKQKSNQEQEKREYIAERKNDCYSIYEKERVKWNNVVDFRYSEVRDVCIIKYTSEKPPKSEEECSKITDVVPDEGYESELFDALYDSQMDCSQNWFSKII